MKRMKIAYAFIAVSFVALLSVSMANASLDVSVTVADPQINKGESQVITATTNERGKGILLVLQPALGDPWTGYLMAHPGLAVLYANLPSDIKTQLQEKIGDKIVSYKFVEMEEPGYIEVNFPSDFKGINGEPSTALVGAYKVIFVFLSNYESDDQLPNGELTASVDTQATYKCKLVEIDFACATWFVIPEFLLGTIAPILSSLFALPVAKILKRKHA